MFVEGGQQRILACLYRQPSLLCHQQKIRLHLLGKPLEAAAKEEVLLLANDVRRHAAFITITSYEFSSRKRPLSTRTSG